MVEVRNIKGMVGLYDDPETLVRAASRVRDMGYRIWDCHTPYPMHGLDRAMGLKASPIPWVCLSAGFLGAAVAMGMQWWMNAVDYPVRIGGKPLFSWPAFVPITFELFVLFAAVATMGAMIAFCRLGRWHSPLHDSDIMGEITLKNRFAIVLGVEDTNFSEEKAKELLNETGCKDIRPLYERDEEDDSIL